MISEAREELSQEEEDDQYHHETREGSNIVLIQNHKHQGDGGGDGDDDDPPPSRRVGKLLGLQGMTYSTSPVLLEDGQSQQPQLPTRTLTKELFYNAVASFLASKHFNERRGDLLPQLPDLLEECNFYWSYEYRDGQQQSREATIQLMEAIDIAYDYQHPHINASANLTDGNQTVESQQHQQSASVTISEATSASLSSTTTTTIQQAAQYLEPFAVLGSYWSRVSQTLVPVASALQIPYITGGSTSSELDSKPYFARTIPTNDPDAKAMMEYYKHIVGATHVAVLYIKDSWGQSYHLSCQQHANHLNITIASFAYNPNSKSIEAAIAKLKASQIRYVFAIMWPWKDVVKVAYEYGIIGVPDYFWIGAELKEWVGDDFFVQEPDIAQALHGVGTINLYVEPNPSFEHAMEEIFHNPELQQEFISIQAGDPASFFLDDEDNNSNFTWPPYDPTHTATTVFDAVMALGLTACNASGALPHPLFTGEEFHAALLRTEFEGVSGHVRFNPTTGTRISQDIQYSIEYVSLVDEALQGKAPGYRFQSNLVAVIQGDGTIKPTLHPYIYNDNSMIPPLNLPPLTANNNRLAQWAQIYGYCLAAFLLCLSVGWFGWTVYNRKKVDVLIASQPFFLCQLCVGTFIMAVAVYPMSLPGLASTTAINDDGGSNKLMLDFACMSTLWLLFVGFSIGSSALASKIYRVNRIIAAGAVYHRVSIKIKHVMAPLYISLSINVALLLILTFFAPMHYQRVYMDNYDGFGRSVEWFGTCYPTNEQSKYILGAMGMINFLGIILLGHLSYKAQDYPDDFSDVKSLTLAMLSIFETLLIGLPFLLATQQNPTAQFLVGTHLLCIASTAVLLLTFVPKYQMRNRHFDYKTLLPALSRAKIKSRKHNSLRDESSTSRHTHNFLDTRDTRGMDTSASRGMDILAASNNSSKRRVREHSTRSSRSAGSSRYLVQLQQNAKDFFSDAADSVMANSDQWGHTAVRRVNRDSVTIR